MHLLRKLPALIFLSAMLISNHLTAQGQLLIFQKAMKEIRTYSVGSYIAFMDSYKQWHYGIISGIVTDSFSIKTYALQRIFTGFDTIRYNVEQYAVKNVFAMPKAAIEINDILGSGNSQVQADAGHLKFYWIKGGWLFRAVGIGYAGLNIVNSLIGKNGPLNVAGLGYAAALFAFGELLKFKYKPYLKLGKRYVLNAF
jgi:hypothetical protein